MEARLGNLTGKLYVEYPSESESTSFEIEGDVVDIQLKDKPQRMWLYLLTRDECAIVDYRMIRLSWGSPPSQKDVTLDITLDDLDEIIRHGENETVEFKLRAAGRESSGDEFVETVVASANTQGGIIVVGVDDDRNVAGVNNASNTKRAVEALIRHRCDPVPRFNTDVKKVNEKSIVVVQVFEGSDKPYLVRGKGPFIRVGSNDYSPLRRELDELTKSDSSTLRRFAL